MRVKPLREIEKLYIIDALKIFEGNRTKCAKALGISRGTFYRKLDEYAIDGDAYGTRNKHRPVRKVDEQVGLVL